MKKYAATVLVPSLVFLAVLWAGQSLLDVGAQRAESTAAVAGVSGVSLALMAVKPRPALPDPPGVATAPRAALPLDPPDLVPADLEVPLRAVSGDVALCIPSSLERDRGPIDLEVHFTPLEGGAFAAGTTVTSSWHDEEIERCVAEVFDETTWMPTGAERTTPSAFVFHFPDDEQMGLLGLAWSPWR